MLSLCITTICGYLFLKKRGQLCKRREQPEVNPEKTPVKSQAQMVPTDSFATSNNMSAIDVTMSDHKV